MGGQGLLRSALCRSASVFAPHSATIYAPSLRNYHEPRARARTGSRRIRWKTFNRKCHSQCDCHSKADSASPAVIRSTHRVFRTVHATDHSTDHTTDPSIPSTSSLRTAPQEHGKLSHWQGHLH